MADRTKAEEELDINLPAWPHTKNCKAKRGALQIATLNMRGGGSDTTRRKWNEVNQLIRNSKIDILAIQETHLTDEAQEELNILFERQLHIVSSIDTAQPNAKGVAFVLNKRTTRWEEARTTAIIDGRALILEIPWTEHEKLQCVNVYAPNETQQNELFWIQLKQYWSGQRARQKPQIVLGDMNIVEDALDRMPAHYDPYQAVSALIELKTHLGLSDGWRKQNPNTIDFSFYMIGRHLQSRIDRIYIKDSLEKYTWNWSIDRIGINTDHLMVAMTILNPKLPYIGNGRYAMLIHLTSDETLLDTLEKMGLVFQKRLESIKGRRTPEKNPQKLHKSLKIEMLKAIRTHSKNMTPKILKQIEALKRDKEEILNNLALEEEERCTEAALLDDQIKQLEIKRFARVRDTIATSYMVHGEMLTKPWINMNKEKKPRDVITALCIQKDEGMRVERNSKNMANIAKEYHKSLQKKMTHLCTTHIRERPRKFYER